MVVISLVDSAQKTNDLCIQLFPSKPKFKTNDIFLDNKATAPFMKFKIALTMIQLIGRVLRLSNLI